MNISEALQTETVLQRHQYTYWQLSFAVSSSLHAFGEVAALSKQYTFLSLGSFSGWVWGARGYSTAVEVCLHTSLIESSLVAVLYGVWLWFLLFSLHQHRQQLWCHLLEVVICHCGYQASLCGISVSISAWIHTAVCSRRSWQLTCHLFSLARAICSPYLVCMWRVRHENGCYVLCLSRVGSLLSSSCRGPKCGRVSEHDYYYASSGVASLCCVPVSASKSVHMSVDLAFARA